MRRPLGIRPVKTGGDWRGRRTMKHGSVALENLFSGACDPMAAGDRKRRWSAVAALGAGCPRHLENLAVPSSRHLPAPTAGPRHIAPATRPSTPPKEHHSHKSAGRGAPWSDCLVAGADTVLHECQRSPWHSRPYNCCRTKLLEPRRAWPYSIESRPSAVSDGLSY